MRRTIHWILVAIPLASFALPARSANILVREQSTHRGSVVYLGDVADISAATTAEMENLATTPLMAAPAPGTQHFLRAAQLRDLLMTRGIDVSTLSIAGAQAIEIGKAAANAKLLPLEPVPLPTSTQSEEAIVAAIKQHLERETGHLDWQVAVEPNATELRDLARLGTDLEASAGRAPWTGTQRFKIGGDGSAQTVSVTARVERLRYVVVTLQKINQGNLIGAADVEIRLQGGNIAATAFNSLDQVIGKEALRAIDNNTVLQASQLRAPLQVQRGETVKVVARTGGISVSTYAVAQQDGSLGDLVQAQTLDKKDRFAARVSGWKLLEVLPTGATTTDYAALNSTGTRPR